MRKTLLHAPLFIALLFTGFVLHAQNVGVGTNDPKSKLDVKGNLTVGNTYGGVSTAPANGAIIEGTLGIGTASPDAKAALDVSAANKGAYIPRLTSAQVTALGATLNSAHKGMLVFNSDANRMEYWDGTQWKAVGDGISGPPSGPAGGDLSGTYPNPNIANDAINSAKVLDGSITGNDLQNNTIDLTTKVNNVLPVSNGGTGVNTLTGIVQGNGGSPMTGITGVVGSHYLRRNAANTAYEFGQIDYSHIAGTPASLPPTGTANGDLTGTYPNPSVDGLQGRPVASTAPNSNDVLKWNGSNWAPAVDANTTYSAGTAIGISGTTINNLGVTSATGTANQVNVSASTGAVTFSLPQNIHTGANPTFNSVTAPNDFFGRINVSDTRNTNAAPNTYDNEVGFEFKTLSAIGAPGSGSFGGLMTMAPWGDVSGNNHHQLFFNNGGIFYRQGDPDALSWGGWTQVLTGSQIAGTTNYIPKFTGANSLGNSLMYDNGSGIGIGTTSVTSGMSLDVNGNMLARKYVVQNSVDGGNSRGIWMWNAGDSNWGIYMGTSGAGRSLGGGTATAGGGFSAHAIRFRVYPDASQGFIFENANESNLFSIRANNGRATFRGGVLFDCNDCGSTSTVDGDGISNWGDLTIQGRVLSTNSNLHLSPPAGSRVIINSSYRAAGGSTGTTGLDIEDGGIRMRKSYRWINRYGSTGGYGWGAQTHDLGYWDFCAVGHFGFRNTNSNTDEDDDVQCAVYPYWEAGGGESSLYDSYFTYQYNARPLWYMYLEGYADTNATNCAASCMNFD